MMESIKYTIEKSNRKTITIQVKSDASVVVKAPLFASNRQIENFVREKYEWIEKHVIQAKLRLEEEDERKQISPEEKKRYTKQAKILIPQRVEYYASIIGVTFDRISIRDQKTRWGSCSGDGNLNFNYKLVRMPIEILDYVVVHELCHRIHMNHSKEFWDEVARVIPDYKERRKWLKDNGRFY